MRKWIVLITLGIFFFMVIVDGSIVNIAIPIISSNLGVPTQTVTRLVLVYLLVITVFLLFFGQLSDQKGRVKIFQLGAIIFTLGSLLSGLSINFDLITVGRIVQAFGASMTMATSYAIVTDTFTANELGKALAIESLFISLGALAGPGIGGLILKYLPWEYIFLVNIPIGILTIIISFIVFKKDNKKSSASLDIKGLILLILIGVTFYLISMSTYLTLILILIGTLVLLTLIFLYVERRSEHPLLNLEIFTEVGVGSNLFASLFYYIGNYFYPLLAPIYLQVVLKINVSYSSLLLMVMPIVTMIVSPFIGGLTDKYNKVRLMEIGLGLMIFGTFGMIITGGNQSDKFTFIVWSSIMAIGTPLFTNPNNTMTMTNVKQNMRGMVGSANSMMRELGMMIGSFVGPGVYYQVISILENKKVQNVEGISNIHIISGQNASYLVSIFTFVIAYIFVLRARKI